MYHSFVFGGEGEIFAQSRALLAPLQLRLLPSFALRSSVGKSQVAATRKISLYPPPAAVDFSPSLTARGSRVRISPANEKSHPYG